MKFRYLIYAPLAVAQPVKCWAAGLTQQNKRGCSRRSAGGPFRAILCVKGYNPTASSPSLQQGISWFADQISRVFHESGIVRRRGLSRRFLKL